MTEQGLGEAEWSYEDIRDLQELLPMLQDADIEEREAARTAMLEILENKRGTVQRMEL